MRYLLGYNITQTIQTNMKQAATAGFLFVLPSTLRMEPMGSFKISANFQQTIQYHIPECGTPHALL
jgi:hypothetical protein